MPVIAPEVSSPHSVSVEVEGFNLNLNWERPHQQQFGTDEVLFTEAESELNWLESNRDSFCSYRLNYFRGVYF